MDKLEKSIEQIAALIPKIDPEDLPVMATLHERFMQLKQAAMVGNSHIIPTVAGHCADLVEKIILRETNNVENSLRILNKAATGLSAIIRDKQEPSKIRFPDELYQSSPHVSTNHNESTKSQTPIAEALDTPISTQESMIMTIDDSDVDLLAGFITETREHCAIAEENLMELETDPENHETIDTIFRGFHTIKGAAGFLELGPISLLAHEAETILDMARSGELVIEGKIADILLDVIDAFRSLLIGLENALGNGESFNTSEIISILLKKLRRVIDSKGTETEFDEHEFETSSRVGDILIDMGATTQYEIDQALAQRESPNEKLGQTLVKQGKVPAKAVVRALREQKKSRDERRIIVRDMVKIDTERLDRLVDTIGKLVIVEAMVSHDKQIQAIKSEKTNRNILHLNKITRELQETGMAMLLVPLKGIFQRLSRVVRDLSRKSGKIVNPELSGQNVEVDRSIFEGLFDPLIHMVRNSIDHGLERPEERIKNGKSEAGHLWIRAYHRDGKMYFEIEDDGRGLDKNKILAKARERGLISDNDVPSDRDIYNVIFTPGFSTAAEITQISGRGVGMDVVKKNIDSLGGILEIESRSGFGTKFTIQLPLTLAVIDGIVIGEDIKKPVYPS